MLGSHWFWVHILSLLFAYASFALAGVLGLIYVLQFKEIKKKHLGYFYDRLPSLQILDAMNSRAVAIGWLFLTTGVVVGIIWVRQARGEFPNNPNLEAMSLGDPKVFIAVLTWAVYSFADAGASDDGLDRTAGGMALGGGIRNRAAELPARQLLLHNEPHLLR